MNLQLLLGRSGSGKSRELIARLATLSREGREGLFLLVPEQCSFSAERALLQALSPAEAARVQVLSFTRLAETVFRETGGVAREPLDEGMRALLMSRALEQIAQTADTADGLSRPGKWQVADPVYITRLLGALNELRQCAVSTDALETLVKDLELAGAGASTVEKTRALQQIVTVYEGLVAASGVDTLEDLTRLAEQLPTSRLPENAVILVDGFKGFTLQELQVLEQLIPRAAEVTVALSTDTPGMAADPTADHSREYALFSPVTHTVNQLMELAARHGLRWSLQLLTENRRNEGALAALEAGLYAPQPVAYEGAGEAVTLAPCRDVYEECAYVARAIRRLLRQEHYRCRDIVVVTRQPEAYGGLLEDALAEQGVPCYADARQEIFCESLIVYIRCALRLAVGGWRTEELLRLLKTDLAGLSPLETAQLENYVYTWSIDGAAWTEPFTENPAGLGEKLTPGGERRLARLNAWREKLMAPLQALAAALRGQPTGRQFALAVYRYLTADEELPRRIAGQAQALEEMAEPVLAAHAARLWDELMGVLDRFAAVLGEQPLPATRLEELFTMLLQMIDLGSIPPGLDAVAIGSAERIRYDSPRAVFILGANEGGFPAYPESDGFLSEEDRRLWKEQGVELSGDLLSRSIEERYYVYMAVAAPQERLTVSYLTEGETAPSPLIGQIAHIVPGHAEGNCGQADGMDLESAEDVFHRLAEQMAAPTAVAGSLRQVLAADPAFAGRLAAVERSAKRVPFHLDGAELAPALYGRELCLSATKTEAFYECPFAYFCQYGLRINPRPLAKMDFALFGTLVHHVMETLLPAYTAPEGLVAQLKARDEATEDREARQAAEPGVQAMLRQTLTADIRRVADAYVEEQLGGSEHRTGQFLYQLRLARQAAYNMLWHTVMELRQSAFTPVDFELAILPDPEEGKEGILSVRLPIPEGQVRFSGKIDRVDLFVRFDGTAFVRVVDYKTSDKEFDINELTAGLHTQLLIYLFMLCENSRRYVAEGQLQPAGALYHPLSDMLVERGKSTKKLTREQHRLKTMGMRGLVLDDPIVIQAMERDGNSVFIPAAVGKNGQGTGAVITREQFALLHGLVERLLTGMARRLLTGDIEALPLQRGDKTPCAYCDYRAVCCREEDDPLRQTESRSLADVMERLAAEEDGEEATEHG